MSLSPPQWVASVNPLSVSMSTSTTSYVEKDIQCTAKPLQGPPLDFIPELLQIAVDISGDSALTRVIKGPEYYRFRSRLTTRTITQTSGLDENEDDYLHIVEGSLNTLIPLAAVTLLQLWINDGASDDTQAIYKAKDILLSLDSMTTMRDPKCRPDHSGVGPKPESASDAIMNRHGLYTFATCDRKGKAVVDYVYNSIPFNNTQFTSRSKDGLIQEVIEDGRPFYKLREVLNSGKLRGKPDSCGWPVQTLHLLAQVYFVPLFLEEALTKNPPIR